jgi:hypothetical protein
MFRLDVLQNQWLILALVGGLGLVFLVILLYRALWPGCREARADAAPPPGHGRIPWFLIVVWVGMVVYGILYVIRQAMYPPTW